MQERKRKEKQKLENVDSSPGFCISLIVEASFH
jgi:hypothetical protein